jgi:hypothetical protein
VTRRQPNLSCAAGNPIGLDTRIDDRETWAEFGLLAVNLGNGNAFPLTDTPTASALSCAFCTEMSHPAQRSQIQTLMIAHTPDVHLFHRTKLAA